MSGTGISTHSARRKKAKATARFMAKHARKLFEAKPMPELQSPRGMRRFVSGKGSDGPFQVVG